MKLLEVLGALEAEMPTRADWRVVVLTHETRDASGDSGKVLEFPVFEISVDEADSEINLLTDEDSDAHRPPENGMTVGQLLDNLRGLRDACADYGVYSGSAWARIDGKHEVRFDSPLIGVARNPETKVYGFLQWPPEQWEPTA